MQHVSTKVNTVADDVKPNEKVFKFIGNLYSFPLISVSNIFSINVLALLT
jgi:hypothetical protein